MSILNLFPARIRFVNTDGTLTSEALRMLEVLVARVGGQLGDIGADMFAVPDAPDDLAGPDVVQPVDRATGEPEPIVQPDPVEPTLPEMVMQPLPQQITADQVEGLGSMALQDVGTNYSGSFTNKTVTVANGIITSVV